MIYYVVRKCVSESGMKFVVMFFLLFLPKLLHALEGVVLDKYIKKYAITLTGKSIIEGAELLIIDSIINTDNDFQTKRTEIIDCLQNSNLNRLHVFYELNQEYLEGISLEYFYRELKDAFFLYSTRKNSIYYDYFDKNYSSFLKIYENINGGNRLTIREFQKLIVDNYVYDQINMGDNNFVISTFQHFIGRKPTKFELEQSLNIINYQSGILFNKIGSSKEDYLNILLGNKEYWQYQVIFWFRKIFHKDPTEEEILNYIGYMRESGSPEKLIKELLMEVK